VSDQKDQFKFDLDAKEAAAQLDGLIGKIKSIGDAKNLAGLVEGLVALAGPIAAVAAGMLAVKVAFDLSAEGEQIEKVHRQFNALAEAVGQGGETMKKNIEASIGTTEDLEDALKSAGRAMSLLGNNSDKIPQFFEIAKKAADAFGGTMNERFDQITNAVARGNAAMLKGIGITVDSENALKKYAASIGTTVSALSEQGRQAAIANAVIEQANTRYKNLKTEQEGIETSTKRFSQAWKEAGDTVAVAFNKAFGPAFAKALDYFSGLLERVGDNLKKNFGDEAESGAAKSKILARELDTLTAAMERAQKTNEGSINPFSPEDLARMQQAIELKKQEIANQENINKALDEEQAKKDRIARADKIIEDQKNNTGDVDNSKKLDQEAKFNMELLKLAEQRNKDQMDVETNFDQFKLQLEMERNNKMAQFDAQIAETRRQGDEGEIITKQQANEMIIQLEADKLAMLEKYNRDFEQSTLKVYDNQVKAAKNANEGIKAAFAQGAAQAQSSITNYGQQGQMVFKTLTSNAASAFRALGDGSKSAGDAMKGFLLGSIADIAEAQGQFLLASGIGTMNPVQIEEGGALIALAGLLRSQSGAAGGGGVGGSSGGGGGGGGSSSPSANQISEKPELEAEKKKAVTVQIMGNYFETEQTKTRLLEMIRENTDATDFKYQQIGVGG